MATAAVSALAAAGGAFCVRVHDVRAGLDAVLMASAYLEHLDRDSDPGRDGPPGAGSGGHP